MHTNRKTRLTPTQIIEKTNPKIERAWFKTPRKKLMQGNNRKWATANEVLVRLPTKTERQFLHKYPHQKNEMKIILPSTYDLHTFSELKNESKIRINAIAIKQGKKVIGYTFAKLSKPLTKREIEEYELHLDKYYESEGKNKVAFDTSVAILKKIGVRIRFVPNKHRNYLFNGYTFVLKK